VEARDQGEIVTACKRRLFPSLFFSIKEEHDGKYSLYNRLTNKCFELNASAAYVASKCDGTRDFNELSAQFSAEYSVDLNEAKKAVEEFLSILEKDRLLIWRTSKVEPIGVPPPKFLILEVTNRCNLNCIHCSVCANEGKRSELTAQEWTTVIADAASMGTQALGLSVENRCFARTFSKLLRKVRAADCKLGLSRTVSY
jgi:hypothetical protein